MCNQWCWVVFVFVVLAAGPVLAWNNTGHMAMARITFANLSSAQRAALGEILEAHPRFADDFEERMPLDVRRSGEAEEWRFAYAATWPDTARHFGYVKSVQAREALVGRYSHRRWHYINLRLSIDTQGAYQVAAGAYEAAAGALSQDPEDIVKALETISRSWPIASTAQRAVALCWLLHLMGDIHQPLHTVMLVAPGTLELGDRGGNEIRVRAGRPGPRNLHALWDGALGKSIAWQDLSDLSQRLERDQGLPNVPASADPINFANWAEQGRALAREAVYTSELRRRLAAQSSRGEVPDFRPDDAYLERMTAQSRSQIVLAARRAVRVLATLELR
jgi:hypothetical protein